MPDKSATFTLTDHHGQPTGTLILTTSTSGTSLALSSRLTGEIICITGQKITTQSITGLQNLLTTLQEK